MPGGIRPNKNMMKIAYKILATPKDKQQENQREVSPERAKEWFRDSSTSQ